MSTLAEQQATNLERIVEDMKSGDMDPSRAQMDHLWLSAIYSKKRILYGKFLAKRSRFFIAKRQSFKTNAEVERSWENGKDGQREIELKYECDALEKLIRALESFQYHAHAEAKNRV
jgi:hypothetical protein